MAKIQTLSRFPSELVIDGIAIKIEICRLTCAEFDAFAAQYERFGYSEGPTPATPLTAEEQRQIEDEARRWVKNTLEANLFVVAGEMTHDGRDVAELGGGALLDIYGGRRDVVPQALGLIYLENRGGEKKKVILRSRLVSALGSLPEHRTETAGSAPDSTAEPAGAKASADPVAATAPASDASSGETAPLS